MTKTIAGTNPHTGQPLPVVSAVTSEVEVAATVDAAAKAGEWLASLPRRDRAALLRTISKGLEGQRESLIAAAMQETGLGEARLGGELTRAVYQLEFFAGVIEEGSYLEATLDPAGDTPMGHRPDLRRMLVPTGVVAVFGASNFPFAFSVAGGDTASALAAGSAVVVKAHSSHPLTSKLSHEAMATAATDFGAPAGLLGIVYGQRAGVELVIHPEVTAVGFTGSLGGGQALIDAIATRQEPIPFYGELSSINPVIVTAQAATERAQQIGEGLAASVTGSAGQLCTKPGVVFLPAGPAGDAVLESLTKGMAEAAVPPLLNRRIFESYADITAGWEKPEAATGDGVTTEYKASPTSASGFFVSPAIYSVNAPDVQPHLIQEVFGPSSLVTRYASQDQLSTALAHVEKSLTATIQHGNNDPDLEPLTALLLPRCGRILFNGYPTGVAVSWAQNHGGPWPATNSLHTSVGATAIRRFLRPVTWQNAPQEVLPEELRDGYAEIPRRVDGTLTIPASA
ncbi:aldehyde dehydrogenase (NADP(+)) [Paenarthrobacter nitroguajacolicus]|uniref:aldehyde dehydrogenase (NADP(+)) n=1 Tax=Paenarthrobacter nitroguajacolicus TaxID=211146 RepID=UPI0015C171AE|nr:aldehyde dehydrogenase (NADP(+)) [Paenarthrobacter nitroguajacolicus]NWL10327.1 aldehyde dehydrogenase (NADP(+)) [Paenarthrobacter nitroguajacolicus]